MNDYDLPNLTTLWNKYIHQYDLKLVNVSIYLYQHLRFQRVQIYVNGNNKLHFTFDTRFNSNNLGQDISLSGSTILNLSASDYVSFHMYKVSSESDKRYFIGAQHSHASMHLLS